MAPERDDDRNNHAGGIVGGDVNKRRPGENAQRTHRVLHDMEGAQHGAACGRDHAGDDERRFAGQGDAVDGRLGDARNGRDKGRRAEALAFDILALDPDGSYGAGLGKGGAQHASQQEGAAAGGHIGDGQGHQRPVQAKHDQHLPQAAPPQRPAGWRWCCSGR